MAGYRLQRKLIAIAAIAGIGLAGIGLPGLAAAQGGGMAAGGSARDAALVAAINAAYGTTFPVPAVPAAKAMTTQVAPVTAGGTNG